MLNNHLKEIRMSFIRQIFEEALAAEKAGRKVYHLEVGAPDFDTPEPIKTEAIRALNDGFVYYTSNKGIMELRQAISKDLFDYQGLTVDPETEVLVTAGASEGIYIALATLLNPGDEVLIFEPAFPSYIQSVRLCGGVPVSVDMDYSSEKGFCMDVQKVAQKITPRTKAMIMCSPNNPTGTMMDASTIKELAQLAIGHNLYVISDEVYHRYVFSPAKHYSITAEAGMKERTILLNSLSKTYSMTGWRVGYVVAPPALINEIIKTHQYAVTCVNSFAQKGAVAAFSLPESYYTQLLHSYQVRKDWIVKFTKENIPWLESYEPTGAFYFFPRIRQKDITDWDAARLLMKKCAVAAVPGSDFGQSWHQHIRFSYAQSMEVIEQSFTAMANLEFGK